MYVAEAMSCGRRTRRDARRQDLLRVARRRRAPAHARATSAMPAVKSRRFLCATQVHAKTLRFPIVFYENHVGLWDPDHRRCAYSCKWYPFLSDISAKGRAAVPGARTILRRNDRVRVRSAPCTVPRGMGMDQRFH